MGREPFRSLWRSSHPLCVLGYCCGEVAAPHCTLHCDLTQLQRWLVTVTVVDNHG